MKELKEFMRSKMKEVKKPPGDFNPMMFSGGNFDDCYYMGMEYGESIGYNMAIHDILEHIRAEEEGHEKESV